MSSQKRKIDISQMVSPFLVLYILHGTQMGEGVLTFTRRIAKVAGYDAWIGILLTWLLTTIIIVIVWKIVPDGQDLIDIHHSIFGKRFGNLLSLLFGVHLLSLFFLCNEILYRGDPSLVFSRSFNWLVFFISIYTHFISCIRRISNGCRLYFF